MEKVIEMSESDIWRDIFSKEELEVIDTTSESVLENLKLLLKFTFAKIWTEMEDSDSSNVIKLMDIASKIMKEIWKIEGTPKDKRQSINDLYKDHVIRRAEIKIQEETEKET